MTGVHNSLAIIILITLSDGAPKHPEAPYGALRRLRSQRRRFPFLPIGTVVSSHKHKARGRVGEPQLLTYRLQKDSLVVLVGVARVLCDHHSRELELG